MPTHTARGYIFFIGWGGQRGQCVAKIKCGILCAKRYRSVAGFFIDILYFFYDS